VLRLGAALTNRLDSFKKSIDDIRSGKSKLPANCPSRASGIATFYLEKLKQDLDEISAALRDATDAIWKEWDNP